MRKFYLIPTLLLSSLATYAYDIEANGIYYNIISAADKTVEVTSGDNSYSGRIEIPATVADPVSNINYAVTSIGEQAFSDCPSLSDVSIPESVTAIGMYAFNNCPSLTSITIPPSVTAIGMYALGVCPNLKSANIQAKITDIDSGLFFACDLLTDVVLPESVTSIGVCAFSWCSSLSDIKLPSHIEQIGEMAFCGCSSLTDIKLPASVSSIGEFAFGASPLASVTSLNPTPPAINGSVFDIPNSEESSSLSIYVPTESVDAYKSAWSDYADYIVAIDGGSTGCVENTCDSTNADACYYTLQGVKVVGNPAAGLYVRRQGEKTTKVIVR